MRVAIAKVRGKRLGHGRKCSFLTAQGSLTDYRNCRHPVFVRAHGKHDWQAKAPFSPTLPRGRWRVFVSAVDVIGNREPISIARSFRLTVR